MLSPPTDRLDKFLAIGCLAVALSSVALIYATYVDGMSEIAKLRRNYVLPIEDRKLRESKPAPGEVSDRICEDLDLRTVKGELSCQRRKTELLLEHADAARTELSFMQEMIFANAQVSREFDEALPLYRVKLAVGAAGFIVFAPLAVVFMRRWRRVEQSSAQQSPPGDT